MKLKEKQATKVTMEGLSVDTKGIELEITELLAIIRKVIESTIGIESENELDHAEFCNKMRFQLSMPPAPHDHPLVTNFEEIMDNIGIE